MLSRGPAVLTVSGFEGQICDIEVWDAPLSSDRIDYYMKDYNFHGNLLSWSNAGLSTSGPALLRNKFLQQPIRANNPDAGPMREKVKSLKRGHRERMREGWRRGGRDGRNRERMRERL